MKSVRFWLRRVLSVFMDDRDDPRDTTTVDAETGGVRAVRHAKASVKEVRPRA